MGPANAKMMMMSAKSTQNAIFSFQPFKCEVVTNIRTFVSIISSFVRSKQHINSAVVLQMGPGRDLRIL